MLTIDGVKYFGEKELSSQYGLSVHWFRRARHEGLNLKYHKLCGRVYYKEKEVQDWFRENLISKE